MLFSNKVKLNFTKIFAYQTDTSEMKNRFVSAYDCIVFVMLRTKNCCVSTRCSEATTSSKNIKTINFKIYSLSGKRWVSNGKQKYDNLTNLVRKSTRKEIQDVNFVTGYGTKCNITSYFVNSGTPVYLTIK